MRYCLLLCWLLLISLTVLTGCWGWDTLPTSHTPHLDHSPPAVPGTDPRTILEKMVSVYQSAASYSDHGFAQIVGKMTNPDTESAPWACTVAFRSPDKLRLEVNEGILVSDGADCFAQIRQLPDQVLKFATPPQWSMDVLFQDVYLDQAMALGIPDAVLRFPPQLVLLFAADPLKTLLPEGSKAELLEPQKIAATVCDLIQISHPDGNRVLWISRENNALLRFDYYALGLPVPEGFESIQLIRIDMNDARFDWDIAPEAFLMVQPETAKSVSEFYINTGDKTAELPTSAAEEHRQLLKSMVEKDCYLIAHRENPEQSVPQRVEPARPPKTFVLKQRWLQPLIGSGMVAVLPEKLLVPAEGNSLAVFDLSGKLLQKIKPDCLRNDELLTTVRTVNDGTGKYYIGISSVAGRAVHLFDDALNPILSYSPDPDVQDTEPKGQKKVVADFELIPQLPPQSGGLKLFLGLLKVDKPETPDSGDSLQLVDLQGKSPGKAVWNKENIFSPFQVDSVLSNGKRSLLSLNTSEGQGSILAFDEEGTLLQRMNVEMGRQILAFYADGTNICVISTDAKNTDVRFEALTSEGKIEWSYSVPSGEYMTQPICPVRLSETEMGWLVVTPTGKVFVFNKTGNVVDSFSFGKVLTSLTVVKDKTTLLIVCDGETMGVFDWE
jgi:outer membrane lipoprotein-sorting protein